MTVTEFERRATYQNGYDRVIDDWKIIDIHQIPDPFNDKNHEVDFYCCNGRNVYLLRLRNRSEELYDQVVGEYIIYLVAEFPIKKLSDQVIGDTLNKFDLK